MNNTKPNPAIISLVVIAVLGLITASVVIAKQTTDSSTPTTDTNNATAANEIEPKSIDTTADDTSIASAYTLKDGDYSATGNYSTPGGQENITISLSIKDDTVTKINAVGSASRGDSAQYQAEFLSGYKASVVGKDIKTIKLSRVAGSSLTSTGFNRAIEKIKDEASSGQL